MPRFEVSEDADNVYTVDVCAECSTNYDPDLEVGEHPDYDSDDMYICEDCGRRLEEDRDGYL